MAGVAHLQFAVVGRNGAIIGVEREFAALEYSIKVFDDFVAEAIEVRRGYEVEQQMQ